MKRLNNTISRAGFVFILFGLLVSCMKDENQGKRDAAEAEFRSYLSNNGYGPEHKIDDTEVYIKYFDKPDDPTRAQEGQVVIVGHIGRYTSGEIYESNDPDVAKVAGIYREDVIYGPGKIYIGYVIPGMNIALMDMPPGSHAEVVIPYQLAWGEGDYKPRVYEVWLHEIVQDEVAYEAELLDSCLINNGFEKSDTLAKDFYYKDITLKPDGDSVDIGDTISLKILARYAETEGRYSLDSLGRQFYPIGDTMVNPSVIENFVFGGSNTLFNLAVNSAISTMREGETKEFIVSSSWGYSATGVINQYTGIYLVPPYTGLHYYIELRDVKKRVSAGQ